MSVRDKIITLAQQRQTIRSPELVKVLFISRQAVARHLKALVNEGLLEKSGSTRDAYYFLPKKSKKRPAQKDLKLIKKLKDLQEDSVFEEVSQRLNLKKELNRNTYSIVYYAFTELLNNAIDHSQSEQAHIQIKIGKGILFFSIEDAGIGIFKNVQDGFGLSNEVEAAHHVFKGKQTTQPENHSGQGIFFTSRIADLLTIRSHRLEAMVDNEKKDFLIQEDRQKTGTTVQFCIKTQSKKSLEKLFHEYANEDFEFDRNMVRVQLVGEQLVSRSQARRFLAGLEKFDRILFDFRKVRGIGQAFADEVFRVFQNRYPKIKLEFINANSPIQFMIARARGTSG